MFSALQGLATVDLDQPVKGDGTSPDDTKGVVAGDVSKVANGAEKLKETAEEASEKLILPKG